MEASNLLSSFPLFIDNSLGGYRGDIPDKGKTVNTHHTTLKGDTAVAAVVFDLTKKGYYVSIPFTESAPYDLICDTGDRVLKIQVKLRADGYAAPTTCNGVRVKQYRNDDFDYYAIVNSDFSKICYPPIVMMGSHFRWDHNVASYSSYNYWEDYKDFRDTIAEKHVQTREFIEANRKPSKSNTPEKILWVPDEELQRLVWEMPTTKLAELLGITDSAVYKRRKARGITKPPRGYWRILETAKLS